MTNQEELERLELALNYAKRIGDWKGERIIKNRIERTKREAVLDELTQLRQNAGEYDGSN